MKAALAWLEQRTGIGAAARSIFFANIPGGAKWRYVWGSVVLFAVVMQFITGFCLWLNYSPGTQSAWESVYYIQNQLGGGWLLRGLHHYTAQLITLVLVLHLLQVVVTGAYRAPREVNFWVTLAMMFAVLMMALSGYQLPWDQKGFWATKVAMNLLGIVPGLGPAMQRVLIGGPDYGHLTLARFFAIHAGLLPSVIVILIVAHFLLLRKHGFAGDGSRSVPATPFWPDQALRNAVVCLAFAATVLGLTLKYGAPLSPPADPSEPYGAARPEWSFLFMFQFLKQFPGGHEIWGAVVIPTFVAAIVVLMPFIARWRVERGGLGHKFNIGFLGCLLAGAAVLTWLAKAEDKRNPEYQLAVKESEAAAARITALAKARGIPPEGALVLLQSDPLTQGPKLFARNCASCHRYNGTDGTGRPVKDPPAASDLAGFASREWIQGLLDPQRISTAHYFGGTQFKDGKMSRFVKKDIAGFSDGEKQELAKVVKALSAEAHLRSQADADRRDAADIAAGLDSMATSIDCVKCHQFHDEAGESAPDLTGYGSREWLLRFMNDPAHESLYGDANDRMPAFGRKQILTPAAMGLIADWLRGDWAEASK